MSPTKKKVYGAVVGTAALGFVIDRLLIGDPRSADADVPGAFSSSAGDPSPEDGGLGAVPFPADLPSPDWSQPLRVPFAPPPAIAQRRAQRLTGAQIPDAAPVGRRPGESLPAAQFTRAHRLNGVFVGESARAIVDGQLVEVGETFDGAVLLKVHGNKAYFKCIDGVAVLRLD